MFLMKVACYKLNFTKKIVEVFASQSFFPLKYASILKETETGRAGNERSVGRMLI